MGSSHSGGRGRCSTVQLLLSRSGIGSLLAYSSPPRAMFVSFAVPSGVHTRSYVAVLGVAVERKGECEEGQQLVTEVGRPSDG